MSSAVLTLTSAFWGVCTFRVRPQDIPASTMLLAVATAAKYLTSTAINKIQLPLDSSLAIASIEITVILSLTATLLFVASRQRRLLQTLTALMGAGTVIGVIVWSVLLAFPALPQSARLAFFVWNVSIMAHILRHALETHLAVGFLVALGYAAFLIMFVVFVAQMLGAQPA